MDHVVFSSWPNTLLLRFMLVFVVRCDACTWQLDSAIWLRLLPAHVSLCHLRQFVVIPVSLGGLAIGAWLSLLLMPLD